MNALDKKWKQESVFGFYLKKKKEKFWKKRGKKRSLKKKCQISAISKTRQFKTNDTDWKKKKQHKNKKSPSMKNQEKKKSNMYNGDEIKKNQNQEKWRSLLLLKPNDGAAYCCE